MRRTRLRAVSTKTRTVRWPALKEMREYVIARERGLCQARFFGACAGPLDAHHVVSRARGGKDISDNLALLCRQHHGEIDRPYSQGRLMIDSLGNGGFHLARVWATDKWEARARA
ncbi:MAG: HNHc protein [candidate division NC10 bacterium]|nr:HNHc protein [candidate division NC10 bacterium]